VTVNKDFQYCTIALLRYAAVCCNKRRHLFTEVAAWSGGCYTVH